SDVVILDKVRRGEIIPPSWKNPDIPEELENIILEALQYESEKRYQNAGELKKDLERFIKNYKEEIPTHRDIVQFVAGLFAGEIEEKGIILEALKEPKFVSKKEEEELSKPTFTIDSITKETKAKRVKMSYKLILADDSTITQKVVNLAFSGEDFEIHSISNGQEVIELVEQINPDIILLDINLPKRNGYEICEFIKNNSKLARTPVIVLKEAFETFDHERIKKLACDDIIQKPFDSAKLVQKVKKILEKKETSETIPKLPIQEISPSENSEEIKIDLDNPFLDSEGEKEETIQPGEPEGIPKEIKEVEEKDKEKNFRKNER
ncbi:MAG: response regulator, partial [Candidatus Aminicenantia bacterium]